MGIKISELTEEIVVTDSDIVAVVDVETTTTKKSKLSNLFKWLLNRVNTWTKQQKIISDGTNSPLVVRNSTDTADIVNYNTNGALRTYNAGSSVYNETWWYSNSGTKLVKYQVYDGGLLIYVGNGTTLSVAHTNTGQLGVGTTTPNASAKLQVDSTTQGFLPPRMTTTQRNAISTPAEGLQLWDSSANTTAYKKSNGWSYAGLVTETLWERFAVGSTIEIANNNKINILNYITNADINTSVSDSFNQLSINATTKAIKTIWTGRKIIHTIRLSLFFVTGNSQFYRIELRRNVDDSIITSQTVFRNPDEAQQTVNIVTRTLSDTDPFVLDGFYIALVNNSGASTTVEDAFELLIINQYQ